MRSFLFSFVIPAWNVAAWLPDAVASVLAQTVGFQKNIQLILVNDGSDDNTGALCARYRDRFPDNVVFLDRPHLGVSAARNAGMAAATGRWLNFLDADDKWDRNACAAALAFFETHPDINIVCFPFTMFGRRRGGQRTNRTFKGSGTADILTDVACRVSSPCICFIKTDIARRHAFDERLTVCEDLIWVTKQVLDERRFGMVDQAQYWYRKRPTRDSTMDNVARTADHVLDTFRFYRLEVLRYAEARFGKPPTWAQHTVMRSLGRKMKSGNSGLPTPEARQTYRDLFRDCLVRIDDLVILAAAGLGPEERIGALALKHDVSEETVRSWIEPAPEGGLLRLHRPGSLPVPFVQAACLRVDILDIEAGCLMLFGSLPALPFSPRTHLSLILEHPDGRRQELPGELCPCAGHRRSFQLNDTSGSVPAFELSLPLDSLACGTKVRAVLHLDGARIDAIWLHGTLSPLLGPAAFLVRAGFLVSKLPAGRGLTLERAGPARIARREWVLVRRVAGEQGCGRAVRTACIRLVVRVLRRWSGKPIWLFCDRAAFAGDNGEALFTHLMTRPERRQVRPIFLLARDAEDWRRLRRIGPVVAWGSRAHRFLFLVADKLISSHADTSAINPLGSGDRFYRDLFNFDFVFLQHGVTVHDVASWLCRPNKNIALFVTAAAREQESILQGDYGYSADQVVLTGLPRHDSLIRRAARDQPQRLVAVMPTWRTSLIVAQSPETGQVPNPAFAQSGYFRFWNSFIRHPRLLEALRQHGYCLHLVMHPRCSQESDKFEAQEPVTVLPHCDYRRTFCEAALLVTDYSSVAFDFALLKKPVIYAQFDRDTFYAGQIYDKGYFDYDRDGFGPVCLDLETTVDAVVHCLETDCVMGPQDQDRVDAFFGPQPENRCRAVLDAINGLGPRPK